MLCLDIVMDSLIPKEGSMVESATISSTTSPDICSISSVPSTPRSTPDQGNSQDDSNEQMEEVWSDDVEIAFYEALDIFPGNNNKKRIRMPDGKVYGRNYLIACYIKQKTGKNRNVKQISSHLQVITRRQKLRTMQAMESRMSPPRTPIMKPLIKSEATSPIMPTFPKILSPMTPISFCQNRPDIKPVINGSNFEFLKPTPQDKPCLWSNLCYTYDMGVNRKVLMDMSSHNLLEKYLPTSKLSSVQHLFDQNLTALFQFVPQHAFYHVKCRANMENEISEAMKIFESRLFYSPYKMEIETTGVACSYGNRVNSRQEKSPSVEEAQISDITYNIYHQEISWSDFSLPVTKELAKLRKEAGPEAIKTVMQNFSYLTVISDRNTSEILLVLAYTFEHSCADSNEFKVFRLVR